MNAEKHMAEVELRSSSCAGRKDNFYKDMVTHLPYMRSCRILSVSACEHMIDGGRLVEFQVSHSACILTENLNRPDVYPSVIIRA